MCVHILHIHAHVCIHYIYICMCIECARDGRGVLFCKKQPLLEACDLTHMYQYIDIYKCSLYICIYMCVYVLHIYVYEHMK